MSTQQQGNVVYSLPSNIGKPGGTAIRLFVDPTDDSLYGKKPSGAIIPFGGSGLGDWSFNGNNVGSLKSIGTKDAFDFPIITNNVEIARFTVDGRLGIGTSAPNTGDYEYLQLYTNDDFAIKLFINNANPAGGYTELKLATDLSDMRIGSGGTGTSPYGGLPGTCYFGSVSFSDLYFATSNIIRGTITKNGDWGVSTTSPLAKFHVSGSLYTTILGDILDNLAAWYHVVTVGGGNGLVFLETNGSTNVLSDHRVNITGGNGGNINVYDTTGAGRVGLSGAIGSSRIFTRNDANNNAFEITNVGDMIAYNEVAMPGLQVGNAGLVSGDLYVDTSANVLLNGDLVLARKV
jgi:hypothetical protein